MDDRVVALGELVNSIRSRFKTMLAGKVVLVCPLCENPTMLTEHVPMSDFIEAVEYYVSCSRWSSKEKGCPFNYRLPMKDLADREDLQKAFKDRFLADDRVEKLVKIHKQ